MRPRPLTLAALTLHCGGTVWHAPAAGPLLQLLAQLMELMLHVGPLACGGSSSGVDAAKVSGCGPLLAPGAGGELCDTDHHTEQVQTVHACHAAPPFGARPLSARHMQRVSKPRITAQRPVPPLVLSWPLFAP